MYFVVHLQLLNKHVVLPTAWIRGIECQYEKFVNNSLNKSQIFLCYYTTNDDAFVNGRPDECFFPDFNKKVKKINDDGSFDGCFYGKLKQYKCK